MEPSDLRNSMDEEVMSTIDNQSYSLAVKYFADGNLQMAELIAHKIISVDSNHAFALGLLGLIAIIRNELDSACANLNRAIALRPDFAAFHNNLGEVHRRREEFEMAHVSFKAALNLSPHDPNILCNAAGALLALQKIAEAKSLLDRANRLKPDASIVHKALGDLARAEKNFDEAIAQYSKALTIDPANIGALINLSICYEDSRDLGRAKECLTRVLEIDSNNVEALINLGNILQASSHYIGSIELYERALHLDAHRPEAYHNMGLALAEMQRTDHAIAALKTAISIRPTYREALYSLGDILATNGWTEEARGVFNSGSENCVGMKIRAATVLPAIPQTEEAIFDARCNLGKALDILLNDDSITLFNPLMEIRDTAFYLSYHGLNNRILKEKLATLYAKACPSLLYEARHVHTARNPAKLIRLGIISKYLYNHSIGKTTVGLVEQLPRESFYLCVIYIGKSREDGIAERLNARADEIVELDGELESARLKIESLELDIIFYQDIGMEPFSYFLAFARLARIQCTSFGHPDTTGIPNMDYFVSSEWYESEDALEHYSEKLFLLKDVGTLAYYFRPSELPGLVDRAVFGLPSDGNIYLCAQSLFKIHPSFDALMAAILRKDPTSHIVLIEGPLQHLATLLKKRLAISIPDVAHRIIFIPSQGYAEFLQLCKLAAVALDTPSFNGMNSSLDALLVGTPVITMPGRLQCTRHTFAMYKRMEISDCIVNNEDDYVEICVRVANDLAYRNDLRSRILLKHNLLFEDKQVIAEFCRFFEEILVEYQ